MHGDKSKKKKKSEALGLLAAFRSLETSACGLYTEQKYRLLLVFTTATQFLESSKDCFNR